MLFSKKVNTFIRNFRREFACGDIFLTEQEEKSMISCFKGRFRLTSPRGDRVLNGVKGYHHGIDLVGLDDTTVYSIVDGKVRTGSDNSAQAVAAQAIASRLSTFIGMTVNEKIASM